LRTFLALSRNSAIVSHGVSHDSVGCCAWAFHGSDEYGLLIMLPFSLPGFRFLVCAPIYPFIAFAWNPFEGILLWGLGLVSGGIKYGVDSALELVHE